MPSRLTLLNNQISWMKRLIPIQYQILAPQPTLAKRVLLREPKILCSILAIASGPESTYAPGSYERSLSCVSTLMSLRHVCRFWRTVGARPELWATLFHPVLGKNLVGLLLSLTGTNGLRVYFKQQRYDNNSTISPYLNSPPGIFENLASPSWSRLFESMESITELGMEFPLCNPSNFHELASALQRPLPVLKKLSIILPSDRYGWKLDLGKLLGGVTENLRSLELVNCTISGYQGFQRLDCLSIGGNWPVDVPWQLISTGLPNLKILNIQEGCLLPTWKKYGLPLKLPISLKSLTVGSSLENCHRLLERIVIPEHCDVYIEAFHKATNQWHLLPEVIRLVLARAGSGPIKEFVLEIGTSPAVRVVHRTDSCTIGFAITLSKGFGATDVPGARNDVLTTLENAWTKADLSLVISQATWLKLKLDLTAEPLPRLEKGKFLEILKRVIGDFKNISKVNLAQYDDHTCEDSLTLVDDSDVLGFFATDATTMSPFQLVSDRKVVVALNRDVFPKLETVRFTHPVDECASHDAGGRNRTVWSRLEHTCEPGMQREFQRQETKC